jgi:hypothetical protein
MQPKLVTCPVCKETFKEYTGWRLGDRYLCDWCGEKEIEETIKEQNRRPYKERIAELEKALKQCVVLLERILPRGCAYDAGGTCHLEGCVRCRILAATENARDLLTKKQEAE